MAERRLALDEIMEILRTTVPRLAELTDGVPRTRLHAAPDDGWSPNHVLAHLRACHDVLGGSVLRILREDHPAWKGMNPRAWMKQTDYAGWEFDPALEAFRAQRAELLGVLEPLPPDAWELVALVRDGGRIATTLGAADVEDLAARNVRATNIMGAPTPEKLTVVADQVAAGALRLEIQQTYPLAEAPAALAAFAAGTRGKIVLTVE